MPEVFESIRCEAYGPGGTALLIDVRGERSIAEVRQIVHAHGGRMGAMGSVSYLFNPVGRLIYPAAVAPARLTKAAVEAGAEDVIPAEREVLTDPIEFETVRAALQAAGYIPISAELTQRASITVPLQGEVAVCMAHLIRSLKDLTEVENVYSNAEIPSEVLASL